MDDPSSFEIESVTTLRRRFNDGAYYFRLCVGELWARLEEDGHPSPGPAGEPFCTRSQILSYWDGAEQVARVHQYLRPDGSLGGPSGLPDPKEVIENGIVYFAVKPDV